MLGGGVQRCSLVSMDKMPREDPRRREGFIHWQIDDGLGMVVRLGALRVPSIKRRANEMTPNSPEKKFLIGSL
jgi:hypothetical protein